MKKKILALVIPTASILMNTAHAANVYKTDTQTLDVYGRIEADMTHAGDTKDSTKDQADTKGELTTEARLGIKGKTRVNDDVSVFGKLEWQVSGQSSDGSKFDTRYAYLGADFGKGGQISFGQQYTPLYNSLIVTIDFFDQWGMEAQRGIYGENRQSGQVVYSNTLGDFDIQAGYQFRNSDDNDSTGIADDTELDNAYSLAGVYHTGIGLNLRAAYARQNFGAAGGNATGVIGIDSSNNVIYTPAATPGNSNGKIDTFGLGADYTLNNLYLAFVYLGSYADNGESSNSDTNVDSYDLAAAYTIDKYRLYTGYGLQTQDKDGSSSQDTVKSYKFGVEYNITSNALAWVEYRHNNADGTYDGANGYGENEFALTGQYNF